MQIITLKHVNVDLFEFAEELLTYSGRGAGGTDWKKDILHGSYPSTVSNKNTYISNQLIQFQLFSWHRNLTKY